MALYLPLVNLHSRMLFVMSIVEIYRAWKTPPRGLLLAVMLLMATIIAQVIVIATKRVVDQTFLSQNVVIFSLVPDYTMFGSQHYNQVLQVAITTAHVPLLLHMYLLRPILVIKISLLTTRAMALAGVLFPAVPRQCQQQRCRQQYLQEKRLLLTPQSLPGPLRAIPHICSAPGFPRAHLGLWSSLLLAYLGSSRY